MALSLERQNKSDPSTWTMSKTDASSLETRILAALNANGIGATSVELEAGKLKGGYICDTMRVFIGYGTSGNQPKSPKGGAREEAQGRQFGTVALSDLPKSVADRVRRTGLEPQPSRLKIDLPLTRASPALDSRRRPS